MEYSIRPLATLDQHALTRVAYLHQSVMHNLMSDLGLPIILRYYEIARTDPSVIGLTAVSTSGEPLGWAVGSPNPNGLNTKIRRPAFWFLAQMFRLAITRPAVLWELGRSVFYSSGQVDSPGTIELTYLGIAPASQNKGIGRALLAAFAEASRSSSYCSIVLSAERNNLHALALYTKSGFSIRKIVKEGRFERYRMERTLSA
jgi:GNAT superfamily N-acetyltransferase